MNINNKIIKNYILLFILLLMVNIKIIATLTTNNYWNCLSCANNNINKTIKTKNIEKHIITIPDDLIDDSSDIEWINKYLPVPEIDNSTYFCAFCDSTLSIIHDNSPWFNYKINSVEVVKINIDNKHNSKYLKITAILETSTHCGYCSGNECEYDKNTVTYDNITIPIEFLNYPLNRININENTLIGKNNCDILLKLLPYDDNDYGGSGYCSLCQESISAGLGRHDSRYTILMASIY